MGEKTLKIEQLRAWQQQKNELENLKQELKRKKEEFNKENEALMKTIEINEEELNERKEEFKLRAVQDYKLTGMKTLTGGVGIRVVTALEYDELTALEWAKQHGMCLALDKTAFEKIAKVQQPDFVIASERVTGTFPKEIKEE